MTNRLVVRVKWLTARAALMIWFPVIGILGGLASEQAREFVFVCPHFKNFRWSLHLTQWKMKYSLVSTASPQSHRFVSIAWCRSDTRLVVSCLCKAVRGRSPFSCQDRRGCIECDCKARQPRVSVV